MNDKTECDVPVGGAITHGEQGANDRHPADHPRPRRVVDRGAKAISEATALPRRFRQRAGTLPSTAILARREKASWLDSMNPIVTADGAVLWKTVPSGQPTDDLDPSRYPHHVRALAAAVVTAARVAPEKLAWAAGLFDGEGCIGAYLSTHSPGPDGRPRKPSLRLVASVAQNRSEVLEEFLEVVGAHGKIYPVQRQKCHNKQCYTLNFDGRHALELLYVLRPHLRRKKYEADAARELALAGRLGMYPGPNGLPPDVVEARRRLARKLSRLK